MFFISKWWSNFFKKSCEKPFQLTQKYKKTLVRPQIITILTVLGYIFFLKHNLDINTIQSVFFLYFKNLTINFENFFFYKIYLTYNDYFFYEKPENALNTPVTNFRSLIFEKFMQYVEY